MSIRLNNYFNQPSLSASGSNESSSTSDNKLFNWKVVAGSIGFLAAGFFLASYYSSDDIEVNESIGHTNIATQVTSVAQDIVLFVSAGIMPALELLGIANLVFREEQHRNMELFSKGEDAEPELMEGLLELKDLARNSYDAGCFHKAERFIKWMFRGHVRDFLCIELAQKSYDAGQFNQAERFAKLIDDKGYYGTVLLRFARDACTLGYKNETARFINLLPDSYEGSRYLKIDPWFVKECLGSFTLEFIRSISNVSLRNELYQKYKEKRMWDLIPDCMSSEDCPPLDPEFIHPQALEAATFPSWIQFISEGPERRFSQKSNLEMLRFRKDDPRKKVLFAVAKSDFNGGLALEKHERVLRLLDQRYDLKYLKISKEKVLCQAIRSGVATGELVHVYIHAHGEPTAMSIGNKDPIERLVLGFVESYLKEIYRNASGTTPWQLENKYFEEVIDRSSNFSSCFSGSPPNLVITLLSCATGGVASNGTDNLAQKMADGAQRTVLAATEIIYTNYSFNDSEKLYHPSKLDSSQNVFRLFNPQK